MQKIVRRKTNSSAERINVGVSFRVESLVKQEFSGCVHPLWESGGKGEEGTATPVAVLVPLPSCYVVLSWTHLALYSAREEMEVYYSLCCRCVYPLSRSPLK